MESKAPKSLDEMGGVAREVAVFSLGQRVTAMRNEYTKEGGRGNGEAVGIFSLLWPIGGVGSKKRF